MATLYRAMTPDPSDGLPLVGPSARKLGVRGLEVAPNDDIPALAPSDTVHPGHKGMSVAPDSPSNLPERRRPSSIAGGLGKDPAWVIDELDLGPDLRYYADANSDRHGIIGPARPMTRAEYEAALAATRPAWRLYTG
jgi:hypothetical protein